MGDLKLQVRSSFRTEMFAAGLYAVLANQCSRKNALLSERLREVSEQEAMHGRLFRQYYRNSYNEEPGSEKLWTAIGKFAGGMTKFVSLEKKLKSLSEKESAAVQKIEAKLKCDDDPSYLKILKRILPDEVSHAAVYGEVFTQ
jgi:rubrerythrin